MSFREKSAWVMVIALILTAVFYGRVFLSLSEEIGEVAPPLFPVLGVYVVFLVLLAIIGHIVIALMGPKDANAAIDERDKVVVARAGHLASYVLGVGTLMSLGAYMFTFDGNLLFHGVFGSFILSQIIEYVLQIWFYRRLV